VTSQRAALIAHRGASRVSPENTLHAFAQALADGADGLECDLRLSLDGEPIIFHDADLMRLTGHHGQFAEKPWSELRHLTIRGAGEGAPHTIPHLRDLVALVAQRPSTSPRLIINVELKPIKAHLPLVTACRPHLEALARSSDLVLSSFDPRVLAAFAVVPLSGPHRLGLLFEDLNGLAALRFLPTAVYDLHPEASLLTDATHAAWSSPGRRFRAWTVDDPIVARRLLTLDPTIALITNRPGPLAAELEEAS